MGKIVAPDSFGEISVLMQEAMVSADRDSPSRFHNVCVCDILDVHSGHRYPLPVRHCPTGEKRKWERETGLGSHTGPTLYHRFTRSNAEIIAPYCSKDLRPLITRWYSTRIRQSRDAKGMDGFQEGYFAWCDLQEEHSDRPRQMATFPAGSHCQPADPILDALIALYIYPIFVFSFS